MHTTRDYLSYSTVYIFRYISTQEGFGLPPLEAMACGCPVIAMATPALLELGSGIFRFLSKDDLIHEGRFMNLFQTHVTELIAVSSSHARRLLRGKLLVHSKRFCGWDQLAQGIMGAHKVFKERIRIT